MEKVVYKILSREQWEQFQSLGEYHGSELDRKDGYIHCSSSQQLHATLQKHFAGQTDLIVVGLRVKRLAGLRWEASRNGEIFPHVYATISLSAVCSTKPWP